MGEPALQFSCFTADGKPIKAVGGSGSLILPEFLDWRGIQVKELYLRRIGGYPREAHYMLIYSQGESRLVIDLTGSNQPVTYHQRKELDDAAEEYIERECAQRGIDFARHARGQ
jgi:hypothetical protein